MLSGVISCLIKHQNTLPSIIKKLKPLVWYAFACIEERTFGVIFFQGTGMSGEGDAKALFKEAEEQGLVDGPTEVTVFDISTV